MQRSARHSPLTLHFRRRRRPSRCRLAGAHPSDRPRRSRPFVVKINPCVEIHKTVQLHWPETLIQTGPDNWEETSVRRARAAQHFGAASPGRYCRCWLLSKLPQVRPAPRAPDPEGFRRHGHAPGSRSKSQDSQQLQACCQSGEVLPIRRKDHPARRKIRSIRKRSVETDCEPAGFAAAGSMRCCNEHIHLLKDRAGSAKEFATRQRRPYTTARSSKHGPSGCALQVGECSG